MVWGAQLIACRNSHVSVARLDGFRKAAAGRISPTGNDDNAASDRQRHEVGIPAVSPSQAEL